MLAAIEGALQKSYAGFGRAVPGRFAIVTLAVAAVLLAVAGVGYVAVEKETDVFELWVDDTSRLKSELDFYDDNFGGSRTQSLVVTPKTKDVNLLTPEALDEVKEITRWFRDLQYKANVNGKEETITHADICSKAVETTNADPCFVFSPLDCFMEGRYAVVGEENNHVPWQGYDGRASAQCINHPNPALRTNLTYEYLRDRCRYFFNIKYPYHIVFGGPRWKDPDTTELKHPWFRPEAVSEHGNLTLDSVKSFRLLFPTLDEKLLHEKGVRKVDFKQAQERDEDILTCPRAACENVPLHGNRTLGCDCTTCTRDGPENTWFNALVALKAKCQPIPTLATQHPECCAWMKSVREHPCVEHLWAWNAQAVQTGAYVLQQCGLPPVRPFIAVDRCKESKLAPNITTTTTMVTTTTTTTPQAAPECWPSNPTDMCGAEALTPPLAACIGGVANEACCGALKDNIGADSDKSSSRCFCYDTVVEGAKTSLAGYNPAADLGAIIDTCNTDFGANVPYANGTSSSSTCSCAAPAPTTSTTTMTTTKPDFCSSPAYPLGGKSDTVSTTLKVASEKEAYDILYGWENLWTKSISAELANSTKYKHIKVSYLSGSSVEDTIKDASNSQIPLLVLGYGLVIVYTVWLFLPFNPLAQRPDVGVVPPGPLAAVAVVCFIALSTWGALGIAGAISTGDVKFNALTLQVVPFLALGLGVNDFLVLAQSLSTCYAERPLEADATSIIAETMRHGGVSVTLSSVTNTFAFLLGMLSGIPAVRAFALHIALAELFNFLLTLFVFPSILFLETRRFLAMDKEQGKAAPAPGAGKEVTESRAKKIVDFFNTPLGMAVRVFLAVLSVALLIFCAFGIPDVKVGLRLTDVIPKGKPLHKYAVDVEDVYCTSPVYLTYRGMDFEKIVEDSLNLNYEFVKDGHNMDFIYEVTSQYNYYLEFIEGQLQSDEVCTWEVTYVKDPWRETINTCEGKTSAACEADCKSRNAEGAQKAAPADKKCKYSNETNTCYCPYRPMLKPEYFYNISTDVKLDEADHREETESGTNIRILDKFFDGPVNGRVSKFLTGQAYDRISAANDTYGKLTAARTLTFAENMCSYDERIKHIKRGREIADASSLNAKGMSPGGKMKNVFPFDWIVYALTEQYLHIEHQTLIALVICCITIFVVMMPFVVHPATSLLVTSVIVKILAELYGLIFWTGLKLNAVTMINLLISVGVAVELTAHVGREFMVSQGTRLERAVKAASDMAWPLTNGALSTFIGIIAIAFSDYEYFRNYFFMQYLLILVISLWNGLVFLPSLLSVVGPPAYNAGEGAGSSAGKDPEQGKSDKA